MPHNPTPQPHCITVDPTTITNGHLTYTGEDCKDASIKEVNSSDQVQWQVSGKYNAVDRSKVHLFMFFPHGASPFDDEAFHTTACCATTPATVKMIASPQDFEYYVAIIDVNNFDIQHPCSSPVLYTDDPIIRHSGTLGLEQCLQDALVAVSSLHSKPIAEEIRRVIEAAIEQVKRIQDKDL
jgi:hypothetical protein